MSHLLAAHAHAWALDRISRLGDRRGQGTVEYVGIVVTMALLLAAVATAAGGWGNDIGNALKGMLKDAIELATGRLGNAR
ncbi:MAG TPA: hypothetical protein VNT51_00330 [Miltoncostaeaceae bacterium]|jgi:hypothetical protein|nr:hypothetical protein [Miltoncostaeaceae bacterium]